MMANVNINFTADSAKVESAIRNLDKEIQKVIAGSTSLEQSFNNALGKTSTNFADLTQKVNGLGTAFEKMRGGTQLANLAQASTVAGGAVNQLIMELQKLNVASEQNTTAIAQTITSLQLNENSLNQVTQVYQRYIQSLAVGSQAHRDAVSQLNLFQNAQMNVANTAGQAVGANTGLRTAVGQLGYTLGDASMFAVNFRMGMMSIANNLPFIAQGFAQARESGLSWKDMLKQGITGMNGLILGMNMAMLAIQVLPPLFQKLTGAISDTKKKLTEINAEYVKTFANETAQAMVVKELSKIVADGNAKMQDRKNALGQIQEKYPDYLKNIDLEKIKAGDLNVLINDGNNLLMLRAEIMARSNRLTSLYSAKLESDAKFDKERFEINWGASQLREIRLKQLADRQNAVNKDFDYSIKAETSAIAKLNTKLPKGAYVPSGATTNSNDAKKVTSSSDAEKSLIEKNLDPMLQFLNETKTATMEVLSNQLVNGTLTQEEYEIRTKRLNRNFLDDQAKVYDDFLIKFGKNITPELRREININRDEAQTESNLTQNQINKDLVDVVKNAGKDKQKSDFMLEFTSTYEDLVFERDQKLMRYFDIFGQDAPTTAIDFEGEDKTSPMYQAYLVWLDAKVAVENEKGKMLAKLSSDELGILSDVEIYGAYGNESKMMTLQNESGKNKDIAKLAEYYSKKRRINEVDGASPEANKRLTDEYAQRKFEVEKYWAKRLDEEKQKLAQDERERMKETLEFAKNIFAEHTAAYKAMAVAQAMIDMWSAWQRALLLPPIWREIEQGLILASGLANIARISGITGFANGGIINSPTLGLVGEAGPEIIAPVRDFASYSNNLLQQNTLINNQNSMELEATVKGTDLVFILQKAERKVNRQKIGGTL